MSDAKDDIFPTARRPSPPSEAETPPRAPAPAEAVTPPPAPSRPREMVVLEFGSFREFIDDYSAYISTSGMFLLDSPRRPGDEVAFEVRLSDDFRLIHGSGRVEWSVPAAMPDQPAGAALRFTDLDEPSRRLVARLVDNYRSAGGAPFEIDERPPGAAADGAAALGPLGESVGMGAETIALPVSLAGGLERSGEGPPEEPRVEAPPVGEPPVEEPPLEAPPVEEPPLEAPPVEEPPVEAPPAAVPMAQDLVERALRGEAADGAEDLSVTDVAAQPGPPAAGLDAGSEPAGALPHEEGLAAAPKEDFDAAKTQIVHLPEDFRLPEPPAPAAEPSAELPDLSASLPPASDDAGFEPADLAHVGEGREAPEPEELLPVIPVDGPVAEDPLAAVDPTGPAMFDLGDEAAPSAVKEVVEDFAVTREVPAVEMPGQADLVDDYYRTSGPPPRRKTFFWVSLCLLAVALGVAAWRFQDQWLGFLPASITGGDETVAQAAPPAVDPDGGAPRSEPSEVPEAPGPAAPEPAAGEAGEGPRGASEAAPEETVATDQASPGDETAAAAEPLDEVAAAVPPATGPTADPSTGGAAAASEPAPPTAAPAAVSGGPSRVTSLSSRTVGDVTEVLIATEGALSASDFSTIRVSQPPARQVIKIFGPGEPFPREAVAIGTDHVRRLRTGFHRVDGRTEVHIVADLTGPGVAVLGTEVRGSTLVVRFGRR